MKIKSTLSMSLIELIISTAIVGIIMVGVVSIDYAARQTQAQSQRSGLLAMRTSATLMDITKSLALATGVQRNTASACVICASANNCCYRQDPALTPGLFTDDTFICYTLIFDDIHKCSRISPGSCINSDPVIGTATSLSHTLNFDPTIANQDFYVALSLTNRTNPPFAASSNNPELTISTQVSPALCSY